MQNGQVFFDAEDIAKELGITAGEVELRLHREGIRPLASAGGIDLFGRDALEVARTAAKSVPIPTPTPPQRLSIQTGRVWRR